MLTDFHVDLNAAFSVDITHLMPNWPTVCYAGFVTFLHFTTEILR
jgi:hypothetical protein